MTKIQLNVLFKKMQKDDKKEVLMFHVLSDELPHADELLKMPGTIVHLTVKKVKLNQSVRSSQIFNAIARKQQLN